MKVQYFEVKTKRYEMDNANLISFFGQVIPEISNPLDVIAITFEDTYLQFFLTETSQDDKAGGVIMVEHVSPVIKVEKNNVIANINSILPINERITGIGHNGLALVISVEIIADLK